MMKLPFNINLEGKVAVITGAGGILCSMFAKAAAQCGAKVALLDINYDAAKKYADEINAEGGTALPVKANVLDKEDMEKAHGEVLSKLGPCDILINGAGGNHPKATTADEYFDTQNKAEEVMTFFDLDKAGIEFVFNLNFIGTLIPTQVFAKDMAGKKGSAILNMSSMNAFTPLTRIPAYSAAKAAISNFTQWLATYFSRSCIRVNAIAPGFFVTNQNYKLLYDDEGALTERGKKIINSTPMSRFGKEEELIGTLLYLLDEDASGFVTGVVIPVDGGFSAYSGV